MPNSGNNILFVSNEDAMLDQIADQLILLRNIDSILIRLYTDACQTIDEERPQSIIIACSSKTEEENCLETIKLMKRHTVVPIILLLKEYDEDFIKEANKAGVSDCIPIEYSHSEILMRTIWSLQKNEMRETHKKTMLLLEQLKIIDGKTGFYTTKQNTRIIKNNLDYITSNNISAVLMAVTPNKNSEIKISKDKLDEMLKKTVRSSDTVIMKDESVYYLILMNTNLSGAMIVWSRLTKNVGENGLVCGCMTAIENKNYKKLETSISNGLEVASQIPTNFLAISDEAGPNNRWLKFTGETATPYNIKLFKQMFDKKLEEVIKPIFEFAKKSAKRKLPNVEIEIISTEINIKMVVKKDNKVSSLILEHSGSAFLNVYYMHAGLDSPENKTTKMDFDEITEPIIKDLIDAFIVEFMSYAI